MGWGTNCVPQADWRESAQQPIDRRFVQSAGPFTLEPGAYNNITLGVAWARAQDRFRALILARGNTADYAEMFREFRGRDPEIGPMLALAAEAGLSHVETTAQRGWCTQVSRRE